MSAQNGQSVQFDILDAATRALGDGAHRCRFRDFAVAELPAENLLPEMEDPQYLDTDGVERIFRFHVIHLVAAADQADRLADARYVRGAKLLLADPFLGGLVRRIKEVGRKWNMERAELQQIALVVTYEAEFSTTRDDPSAAGY